MKVRGTRECQSCGTRWSYFDTGSVECPACGSLRSVGVDDDRRLHTTSPTEFDLTDARNALESESLRSVAERAVETTREYLRATGFVSGGELQALSDTYLAAAELRAVADTVGRARAVDDDEEFYFLSLLRGADAGERPTADAVPESMRDSRGLAYATAVREYRSDLRAYLDEHPDPVARDVSETLGAHVKRVRALEGDVPVAEAESLVAIARALGRAVREDDETALAEARSRLDRLS
jgi:uncharacterized Zn finger protein (UPF0148 family)